jgi:hypothetical protein
MSTTPASSAGFWLGRWAYGSHACIRVSIFANSNEKEPSQNQVANEANGRAPLYRALFIQSMHDWPARDRRCDLSPRKPASPCRSHRCRSDPEAGREEDGHDDERGLAARKRRRTSADVVYARAVCAGRRVLAGSSSRTLALTIRSGARQRLPARRFASRTKSATASVSPRTAGSMSASRSAASPASEASALRNVLRR